MYVKYVSLTGRVCGPPPLLSELSGVVNPANPSPRVLGLLIVSESRVLGRFGSGVDWTQTHTILAEVG